MAFAARSIAGSNLVDPRRPNPTNPGAYESESKPLADMPGTRFSFKCYLVAAPFPFFDVEAVFVFPWVVVLRELGWVRLWQMVVFLGVLGSAFVCEIGRGGLEWDALTRRAKQSPLLRGVQVSQSRLSTPDLSSRTGQ